MQELPHMKEKAFGALIMLVVAACIALTSTYAWVTLSRSPEVSDITTTLAANGALEIALAKPDGSQPEEFDIDESVTGNADVTVSNLQWGNLVNLSDASYGIDNLALRPAQLNTTSLLSSPLWGAVYGSDGRITNLDSSYAYAKYNGSQFLTSNEYGVRAIATYRAEISDATQQAYNERVQAVVTAHTNVNQVYANVAPKFSALGTMISKYAQNKLDDGYTDLAPYISDMIPLYEAVRDAMDAQKEAYVALANLQNYLYTNKVDGVFTALTWDDLYRNRTQYNAANADTPSSNGNISLVGLTQFIKDYEQLQKDIEYLELYEADFNDNRSPYYWGGYYVDANGATVNDNSASGYTLSNIVAHLIDYATMTIDLDNNGTETRVTSLGMSNAGSLLGANNKERKVYAYNGILYRLEQSAVDHEFRINGNAACTIKVTYVMSITVYGKAYTKAAGACSFMENYTASMKTELVPNDAVAEDTYGLAIDLWLRTNAEETCLTLEGATSTDVQGNIVSYDGINRVWGSTGEAVLTTDSTTQGGGSCYIYYADTPEDMARSLDLLDAMKVAFVDSAGNLLATAEMDTTNYWAVNGRITVPLVLGDQTKTTYVYTDEQNVQLTGYAVTTLYTDVPVRVTAIVYLDGTRLSNDDVLAAAEIQGTLNIQFGSSTELKTVGSNELIDDTRSVTATVSKSSLNYDTATSDDDLTTTVSVNVEGADPSVVTAFFVRAINSTQGTREETMTFTKQPSGAWTCDYLFTAPGTYYLRQVRLDGVDYTLADPQMVEVDGFALRSVTWSEESDSVVVRTSDNSHSTTVTVAFASNDASKLPSTVQARFVRDDGNTVNIPLIHNASGSWVGTGSFSASGVYQLQYLVADGRYIDLALSDGSYRTMNLSLGMYVTVADLSGGLVQIFDQEAVDANEEVYHKEVAVRVYNNAGTQLEGLEGLKLYYGTSATNTIYTILTWDDMEGCYIGTLPIIKAGRYSFFHVEMGNNILTKCTESPVYTVISPDPPVYSSDSVCGVNENGIQFVPLTNSAVIDGLVIDDSAAATVSIVVYSAAADQYFVRSLSEGTVYTTEINGRTSWTVQLPTYTLDLDADGNPNPGAKYTQEGDWSVAAVMLSDCYDANTEFRGDANPILWVASGSVGQGYLSSLTDENGNSVSVTPDAYQDFSGLTTTVSSLVRVSMSAGTIALGSSETAFGTVFNPAETGMSVTLTDGAGRIIPKDKITDVTLNLSYSGNDDTAYGYKVSGYSAEYAVKLNEQGGETGARTVSESSGSWYYAGSYTVKNLKVTIGDTTLTYSGGDSIGVPTAYTVTTMAPSAANVTDNTISWKQTTQIFGLNDSGDVTGTFLEEHSLRGTNMTIALTSKGGDSMSGVVLDGLTANLVLTHRSGSSETYGGYTISGDPFTGDPFNNSTAYPYLTLAMSKDAGTNTYYAPTNQPLLAGSYTARMEIAFGGVTKTISLSNVEVYSVRPDVKITGVSPTTEVTVNANTDQSNNHLAANASPFKATNQHGDYYAVVYMAYNVGAAGVTHEEAGCEEPTSTGDGYDDYLNYTQPGIQFTLLNGGTGTANINVDGIGTGSVALTNDAMSEFAPIGKITTGTAANIDSHDYGFLGLQNCWRSYTTETATLLGTKTIKTVTSTVGNATVTRTLANPLTVSQLNREHPALTWNTNGVTISVKAGTTTYTGTSNIPAMTSLTATVTANNGYHHPTLTEPEGVYDWALVSSNETTAVYTFKMSVGNATLKGSATKYPAITFSNANNATVAVTVDGTTITSNTGGKTDAQVVVTVTSTGNYCLPRMAVPSGVTDWTASEGDFVSTYTFTMPNKAVSLAAPTTTAMYPLTWTEHTALDFYVSDSTGALSNGAYVVPGHTLTITLNATGGVNPTLVTPADATLKSSSAFATTYTYTMPHSALNLTADAESYPVVKLDNSVADFTVFSNNVELSYVAGAGVSIKPGNTVKVVLTAKAGYHSPRMSRPDVVDASTWTVVTEETGRAEYTFTMPNDEVDASNKISATGCTVTYNANGGSCSTTSQTYAGTELTLPTATRTGYKFLGWYTAASGGTKVGDAGASYKPSADITLYAQWAGYVVTYNANSGSCSTASQTYAGTALTLPTATRSNYTFNGWYTATSGGTKIGDAGASYTPSADITLHAQWTYSGGCFTPDTLITLADGTQKRIDEVGFNNKILAWDFFAGGYVEKDISLLVNHGEDEYRIANLEFSDGTVLRIIADHGVYDYDLNKYVYFTVDNMQDHIGHRFVQYSADGGYEIVTLVNAYETVEITSAWSISSAGTSNAFAAGMLTVAPPEDFYNWIVMGGKLMYDVEQFQKDVATYGLYTYDDFKDYVTYEQFVAWNGAYLKVAVEKGLFTFDYILELIELYKGWMPNN